MYLLIELLRSKEDLEYFQKEAAEQIEKAQKMIDQNCGSDIDPRHKCSYYLLKDFYTNMKIVLDREVKVANYFVERVHRAPWNVCDQYISSIIEVGDSLMMNGDDDN